MSEKKAIVRINDMEPGMAEEAFASAMEAMETKFTEEDIADYIKSHFESRVSFYFITAARSTWGNLPYLNPL